MIVEEQSLADALREKMDGRSQRLVAERIGITQNYLSMILKGMPVRVNKAALGILKTYPELWPFFLPRDIIVSICKEAGFVPGDEN